MKQSIRKYLIRYKWFRRLPVHVKFTMDCMVYRDDRESEWVASCLDLGLVATGARRQEAMNNLKDVIQAQIQFTAENDNWAHLFHPAPADEWQKFLHLTQEHSERCKYERLATSALKSPVDLCFA
jgi:predicted RNase H-like HicB family nuclease